jgi:hypothetical protein
MITESGRGECGIPIIIFVIFFVTIAGAYIGTFMVLRKMSALKEIVPNAQSNWLRHILFHSIVLLLSIPIMLILLPIAIALAGY